MASTLDLQSPIPGKRNNEELPCPVNFTGLHNLKYMHKRVVIDFRLQGNRCSAALV